MDEDWFTMFALPAIIGVLAVLWMASLPGCFEAVDQVVAALGYATP